MEEVMISLRASSRSLNPESHSFRSNSATRATRFCGLGLFFKPKAVLALLKATASEWSKDNVPRMGAALAYYSIFSLAPLLVIAIAISGLAFGARAAQGEITKQIQGLIGGDGARAIQTMILSVHKPTHSAIAGLIGVLTLFLGASGVFGEMRDALNSIWHVKPEATSGIRNLIGSRCLGCGLALGVGFLLLISLLLSTFLAALATYLGGLLPRSALLQFLDFLVSFSSIAVLFAMIFKMLPKIKIAWSDVWAGAVLTSLLFTIGKFAIGFYIGKSALASAYGATGSLVIVVAWTYYSALILYFGAEFTHVYAKTLGSQRDENLGVWQ
jgi:membrane protein